ncbi:hypothetical protein J8L98_12820 [Pseudoalteromonas sp. MMG013]|uniref:tetratricopeptide repeat protein n=2 Tax=unclassified Pseudoalteromonas TaxID=194690 RepID=UPI001B35E21E|nr:hypothetical protein [Pseudoalteromonas sp. MMG013]MBQ4862571.1 hypothetical protein [Pseudoalteromonas sp. MMG013]
MNIQKVIVLFMCLCSVLSRGSDASVENAIEAFENNELSRAQKLLLQNDELSSIKFTYLARIAFERHQLDDAENYIIKAIQLDDKNAHAHFVFADIAAKQADAASVFSIMGYLEKVKQGLTLAVEFSPNNVEYRESLIQYHMHVPTILGGDLKVGLKHAHALKKVSPLLGATALIQVYGKMGDEEKLSQISKLGMRDFGDEPQFHYQLGIYHQTQGRYADALVRFRKATELDTNTPEQSRAKYRALFQIGRTSVLSERDLDEGEKALKQYLNEAVISNKMPTKEWTKFRLANILEAKGLKLKAKRLYQDLANYVVDDELKKQLTNRIKKLKSL